MELRAHKVGAISGLEIVPAHPQREWMNQTEMPMKDGEPVGKGKGFANRCLPMLMANQIGWEIRTKFALTLTTLPTGQHIKVILDDDPRLGPINNFGSNLVTWPMPWVFQTPDGWDLLVTAPFNHKLPDGITVLSGLVETDHAHQTFTVNWKLSENMGVYVPAGTPICALVPFPTPLYEGWSLNEDGNVPERHKEFVEKRNESNNPFGEHWGRWDKDYWNESKRKKLPKDK